MRRNQLYQTFISPSGQNLDLYLYDAARDAATPPPRVDTEAALEQKEPKAKYLNYLSSKPKRLEGGKKSDSKALVVYKPHNRR